MAVITLFKPVYDKNQYQKVIDTSFTQLVQPTSSLNIVAPTISTAEFFQNYQQIFFQIPKFGETNSHEYLIKTSQEYIGSSSTTDDTIQALIDEITQLRQENLDLQQQLITGMETQTTSSYTPPSSPISTGGGFSGGGGGGGY